MPPEAAKPHSVSELIHPVFGLRLGDPCHGLSRAWLAMGCFWGAERLFWRLPGVRLTAVGYLGGWTDAPSYEAVCTGNTGHAETVMVVFDERSLPYEALLAAFFEGHDPTQGGAKATTSARSIARSSLVPTRRNTVWLFNAGTLTVRR